MIPVRFDYATPSVLESDRDRALVGMSANRRRPVSFHGRIAREPFLFRVALRSLGEVIWSADSWAASSDILDPVVTVHPDGLVFEAFSQDQSVYAQLKADASLFDMGGETRFGTTNVDFTAWLWAALAEIRTHRETWLRVESGGVEVKTVSAGGRFEKKVDLPESWIRGFLHLQHAMAVPGTRITVRPVDLLAPIRFLRYSKSRISPRAIRYEFPPGQPAAIVLEPWEQTFVLRGADHSHAGFRCIRNWGRRRLRLIEPLLPFATEVDIHLKGRAMPSFYVVRLPGLTFTFGLSGWSENPWTDIDGFATLGELAEADGPTLAACLSLFRDRLLLSQGQVAESLGVPVEVANRLLSRLCRQGLLAVDLDRRAFRYRELLETPIEEGKVFPPSPRMSRAIAMAAGGTVRVAACEPQETRKIHRFRTPDGRITREVVHRDWHVTGSARDGEPVEIVVKDNSHIIFGTCTCPQFRDHLLSQGPCEEMLALFLASRDLRQDLPVAREADPPPRAKEPVDGETEEE